MTSTLKVLSYHINIDEGDSAVHLLVEIKGKNKYVMRSVLVDGGKYDHGGEQLYNFITEMRKPASGLKWDNAGFDTIIVTHWDDDHWGGLVYTLQQDIIDQVGSTFTSLKEAESKIRSAYSRITFTEGGQPATYIYMPYELAEDSATGGAKNGMPEDWTISSSRFPRILGTDFFRNTRLPKEDLVYPRAVSQYLQQRPENPHWPAMICVASDSKVLLSEQDAEELMGWELKRSEGWQNWAYAHADQGNIQSESTSGVIDVDSTNTTEKRHDDVSVNLIPGSTTDNNQASIACMIFWPNKDALVTHYFAGDCGDQVEADIMSWASDPVDVKNKKSPRVIINVRAVKLSHHGSKFSTPLEMLPAWKPRVIVISNGENSIHHHPTWETMILIAAYIWWRRSDNYRVWCTNFPVYSERLLTKETLGYIKNGIGSVKSIDLKPDSGRTNLADYLWKFWDVNMIREDRRPPKGKYRNPLRYCQEQDLSEDAVAEHLADYVKYHWNSISGWKITNRSSNDWKPPFKGAILVEQHRDGFVRAGSLPEIDADAIKDSLEGNFADAASISEVISSSKLQPIQTKTVTLDISGLTKIDAGGIVLNKIEGVAIANRPQFPEIGDGGDGKSGSRNWQKSSPGNESTDAYAEQDTHTKNQENERTSTNIAGAVSSPASLRDVGLSGKAFTNELYYFVGSQTQINDTSIPPPVMVDPKGGDLDILLAMLGTGAFVFKSPLTDKPDRIFLDSSDETWQRFYSVFNVKNDMSSCPISFEASSKGLDNMQVTIQLKALDINTSIAMDPEPPILSQNLLFDSSNNRSAFGTENPIGFTGTSHGYILSLGNDSNNQSLKIPLSQLLNLFNFASDSLILQSILKIEGFPECVLDTSSGVKNCIWCFPGDDFSTHLRLQFAVDISTIGPKVQAILDEYLGLKVVINAMRVIAKQSWSWNLGEDGITLARQKPEFIFLCDMEIYNKKEGGESQKFRTAISFGRAETKFVVMLIPDKQDSTSVSNLLHWIGGFFGADINMEDIFPGIDMNKIFLHRLSIICPDSGPKKTELVMQVSWSSLILMLTLSYDSGFGFKATLFPQNKTTLAPVFSSIPFMPDYEDWDIVIPAGSTEPPEAGDLNEVITSLTGSQSDSVKEGPVSFQLTRATLKLERKKLSFMAMISGSNPNSQDVPCVKLDYGRLMLAYDFNDKTTKPTFSVATGISLQNSTKTYGTTLAAALSYERGIWSLSGSVFRLNGGLLYSLFDQNSNLEMVNFFQKITLDLFLSYTYAGKDGNQFVAKGRLYLAGTTLAFDYFHKGKDGKGNPDWGFAADLIPPDSEGGGTSLVSIIASICGSDVKDSLPECLENLLFKPTPGEASRSLVHLSISRHAPGYLVFLLRIKITPSITATFLQLQKKVDRTPNAQGLMPTAASPPKRALMFTLGALPEIPDIPVIGKIPQPFDELDIVWVDGGGEAGLTDADMNAIQLTFSPQPNPLRYKPIKGSLKLTSGFHFLVVNEQKALYDCASAPKKKTKDLKAITAPETDAGSDKATPMAPTRKKIGPVEILGLGLKFDTKDKKNLLSFSIDATVTLGPVTFAVKDFRLTFDITGLSLDDLSKAIPKPSIGGLAASFDRPPLTLAGAFAHQEDEISESFLGGAIVGYTPYKFEAAGYYGKTKADKMKSFFAYCKLNGPLMTLGYANINGITGGFGYNSNVKFPTPDAVLAFPLMNGDTVTKPNIADTLDGLMNGGWFMMQRDSFWVAAGLTVFAFQILTVEAVAVVQWTPQIKIGVFGIATAVMPKGVTSESAIFAKVQLGIVATLDIGNGVLAVEGQLTPSSFVLDKNCHLRGGFAFYTWFEGTDPAASNKDGTDWVFTIGGYHPSFKKPPRYPNPPRLGIYWNFSDAISITGEAYFAITPKVCMGGGRLNVSLVLGPLNAFFDAFVDFLINYKPFNFRAQGGLTVGVRYTLDLWITSIHIDIEIGARIYLYGPPIYGTVHVDFWVFGFDVKFGAQNALVNSGVDLEQFYDLVLQKDATGASIASVFHHDTNKDKLEWKTDEEEPVHENDTDLPIIFSCQSGLIPSAKQETKEKEPWKVTPMDFSFMVSCKFAIQNGFLKTNKPGTTTEVESIPFASPAQDKIYGKPMKKPSTLGAIGSTLTLTITQQKDTIVELGLEADPPVPIWKKSEPVMKPVPSALWGEYLESQDPSSGDGTKQVDDLLSGSKGSINLMMGVTVSQPDTVKPTEAIKEFDVLKTMSQTAAVTHWPPNPSQNDKWSPEEGETTLKDVSDAWLSPKLKAQDLIDKWASLNCFQWDSKKMAGLGTAPEHLTKNMKDHYVAAPRISVAKDSA
ncbi:hypothetical protein TWF103_006171 [Orbilia oligospora]|nr:hypothetical protein TWF103_006171 [Orbilia oligospora]